jgi:hypothetical protein
MPVYFDFWTILLLIVLGLVGYLVYKIVEWQNNYIRRGPSRQGRSRQNKLSQTGTLSDSYRQRSQELLTSHQVGETSQTVYPPIHNFPHGVGTMPGDFSPNGIRTNPADITTYPLNDIKRSGRFTAEERRQEYWRRGKSPSGVIDGIYNDTYRGNDTFDDTLRDWDADA